MVIRIILLIRGQYLITSNGHKDNDDNDNTYLLAHRNHRETKDGNHKETFPATTETTRKPRAENNK